MLTPKRQESHIWWNNISITWKWLIEIFNEPSWRLQIRLPWFKDDPERSKEMEIAISDAVSVIKWEKEIRDFRSNDPNMTSLVQHAKKELTKDNKEFSTEDLELATLESIKELFSRKKIRDICDFVLWAAHYRYMKQKSYLPYMGNFGTITPNCPFGIPREIDNTTMDTEFRWWMYTVNPYNGYAERADICREKLCNEDWDMVAHIFNWTEDIEIKLNKTTSSSRRPTNIKYFDEIWEQIETRYTQLIKNKGAEDALSLIAEIHRWFAQMMPYARWSAAIWDLLSKTLLDYCWIKSWPYKSWIAPDLEAYVEDRNNFIRKYKDLFEYIW